MTEQPKTVVCTSCSAKFLVPDELIRGKLVKFRCRKCGSVIEADGRKTARAAAAVEPRTTEVTAVDTPATFSQRTEPPPPPPPPAPVSNNGANLHPWPEPPRPLSTAPTSISEPPEASLPRVHTMRDPSNRGPKIAAIVALLVAAGLSGVGLAMRGSPPGAASAGETTGLEGVERPYVPPGVDPAMRPGAEARRDDSNRLNRGPTRVTDLPRAAAGPVEDPPTAGGTIALAKPSETMNEKQEPTAGRQAINVGPAVNAAPAVPIAAPATPLANAEVSVAAEKTEPSAAGAPPAATANAGAATPLENGAAAATPSAAPNGPAAATAAPQVGVNPSSLPVAPPPAARAKGDFNTQAAREALEDAADRANKCKTIDTPSGNGRVAVTFAPNGHVTNAIIDSGPLVGTAAGTCVASKFRSAKVPPFSGEAVVVRKNVKF